MIYSTDGLQVTALRITDGQPLWTWDIPPGPTAIPSLGDLALG
ncbi:MAG TPA: hypothetical protein VKR06_28785 [Ktedonosporobacter sp.]|nr:hypothetical protein [Ktedonosporobacter sp.]